jgi:hypothetical protein
MKYLINIFVFCFVFQVSVSAQSDSTKVKKIDNEVNTSIKTNQLRAKSASKKIFPNSNIDLTTTKKVNKKAISSNLYKYQPNKTNILLETQPEDRDIMGKKYFMGKDETHKKLGTNHSLGTIYSVSKEVKIECRDHSYVDGDRIRILVNDQPVSTNIGLKGHYYVLYIPLKPGYNKIDFQALNMGSSGPNTAELRVYDDKGVLISSKEWGMLTGEIATLGIIKKQQ